MRALILFTLFGLAACSTDNHPLFPQKEKARTPAPTKPEIPPTTEPAPPSAPEKWVPHDYDVIGRWKTSCAPDPALPGKTFENEIYMVGDRIHLSTYTYSDNACTKSLLLATEKSELIFEEGWEDSAPNLGGTIVKGWRGLFIKEGNGDQENLEVSTHLVEESGTRVLYMKWSVQKPVLLDPIKDRYLYVGAN